MMAIRFSGTRIVPVARIALATVPGCAVSVSSGWVCAVCELFEVPWFVLAEGESALLPHADASTSSPSKITFINPGGDIVSPLKMSDKLLFVASPKIQRSASDKLKFVVHRASTSEEA